MRSKNVTIYTVTILFLVGVFAPQSSARTIIVGPDESADYDTIQEAINNSTNGDTIEVQPKLYHEQINFYGKAITITSTDPNNINVVYATTIDADSGGNVVTFDSGEDAASKLIGFTIQYGNDKGIYCFYSDPLISKCLVRFSSYGIYGSFAEPDIIDCIVRENSTTGIYDCDGEIENCEVVENSGHGISGCDGSIANSNIIGNLSNGLYKLSFALFQNVKIGKMAYRLLL